MLLMDWFVARSALKLAPSYDTVLRHQNGTTFFSIQYEKNLEKAIRFVKSEEIPGSIDRLVNSGYLVNTVNVWGGDHLVQITPKLRHWLAFWLDAFTKKFWAGFFSGVAASLIAAFIYDLIR